jgi:hypothetical protein
VQLAHGGGDRERGQALEKAEGVAPWRRGGRTVGTRVGFGVGWARVLRK